MTNRRSKLYLFFTLEGALLSGLAFFLYETWGRPAGPLLLFPLGWLFLTGIILLLSAPLLRLFFTGSGVDR